MLLADLHIHTTWSDGKLPMGEVVDLFGRSGHDVIAITDHVVNSDTLIGKVTHRFGLSINRENFATYRDEIEREARRAWDTYRMIVLAGCELTQNAATRRNSAHVLSLDLDDFISADGTVEEMLVRARNGSRLVVACHPHEQSEWFANTFYLWNRREEVAGLIDLWEIACRWISSRRLREPDSPMSATATSTTRRISTPGRRCFPARRTGRPCFTRSNAATASASLDFRHHGRKSQYRL
ncbi:MAG TPA: PHP domain-containing protein [Thermoanaerobaculia bacterium]|nr:PHP domain-containing protein [Thermoanaerobaculia bacterium]